MSSGEDLSIFKKKEPSSSSPKLKGDCNVCGDKAFYNFYGSLACDSCRTFFRRQVLQNKELHCENGLGCYVTIKTRKECSKCRLNKCYAAGMRIELVAPNEEQRIRRGRSTNIDRLTSRTQAILGTDSQPVASTSVDLNDDVQVQGQGWKSLPYSITHTDNPVERNPNQPYDQGLNESAGTSSQYDTSSANPSPLTLLRDQDHGLYDSSGFVSYAFGVNRANAPVIFESGIELPKFRKFVQRIISPFMPERNREICGAMRTIPAPIISLSAKVSSSKLIESNLSIESIDYTKVERIMKPTEAAVLSTETIEKMSDSLSALCISDSILFQGMVMNKLMDEILIASKILTGRYYEIVGSRSNEVVCATKLLYFGIQRVLKSCQSFSHFRDLSLGDQEMLIKGSCTEMLLIRSLYHVNLELDAWIFYSPSTGFQVNRTTRLYIKTLEKIQKDANLYNDYHDLVRDMDQKYRNDNHLLTIVMAVILFNSPDRYNSTTDHKLRDAHKLYIRLLKNYLEVKMDEAELKNVLWKLSRLLARLRLIREDYERGSLNLTHADLRGLTETFYELSI